MSPLIRNGETPNLPLMSGQLEPVRRELRKLADAEIARHSTRFFKAGPGEYGEGDRFLGIRVPELRRRVRHCRDFSTADVVSLLESEFHEERLFALLILVDRYDRGDEEGREEVYQCYLAHRARVDNWDLVDASAARIVGAHLAARDRRPLYELARSNQLWDRRIAIIATYHMIRKHDFDDTLAIADILIRDAEDLIHKSVGWMLREVGNRDRACEEAFLLPRYLHMPRTMLRYAIERFPAERRRAYLRGHA